MMVYRLEANKYASVAVLPQKKIRNVHVQEIVPLNGAEKYYRTGKGGDRLLDANTRSQFRTLRRQ